MGCRGSSWISGCPCELLFVPIGYSNLALALLHCMSYLPSVPGLPTYRDFRIDSHQMRGNSSVQTSSLASTVTQGLIPIPNLCFSALLIRVLLSRLDLG